jgi:biopolymer transport protein ExbD
MNVSSGGSSSGRGRGSSADFDLNLAPIIDCFTVLIAFLLASASFLSIGIFETTLPVPSAAGSQQANQQARLDVILSIQPSNQIQLSWSGIQTGSQKIEAIDGKLPISTLNPVLTQLKGQVPTGGVATLELRASETAVYADLIQLIESVRPHFPGIALGGF